MPTVDASHRQPTARPTFGERLHLRRIDARRRRQWRLGDAIALPGLAWRAPPRRVDELLLVPSDIRPPDPVFFTELRSGTVSLAGHTVDIGRQSPFAIASPPAAWLRELHGFAWLNHLAAATSGEARSFAGTLVSAWMADSGPSDGPAWQPQVAARRVISWLTHSGFALDGQSPDFYRTVLRSLGQQLHRLPGLQRQCPPGIASLQCRIALLLADLAIKNRQPHRPRSERALLADLDRQIDADGCHVSRNPAVGLELMLDLLPLRRCYRALDLRPPAGLEACLLRMAGFLRLMRRADGSIARFNGMGASRLDIVATVLALMPEERAADNGTGGGYVRLAAGPATLHLDTAAAPPLEHAVLAHAGCLSFEFAAGRHPLVVNCGPASPAGGPDAGVARTTARHSTLVLADSASARLVASARLAAVCGGNAVCGPPTTTRVLTAGPEATTVEASHDGYVATHGLVHTRRLTLSQKGTRLDGLDRLAPRRGVVRLPRDLPFSVHFHLPPGVTPVADPSGALDLLIPGAPAWRFTADGLQPSIETTTIADGVRGAEPSLQIVLRGTTPGDTSVSWSLSRKTD